MSLLESFYTYGIVGTTYHFRCHQYEQTYNAYTLTINAQWSGASVNKWSQKVLVDISTQPVSISIGY